MRALIDLAVRRRVSVLMAALAVVAFGVVGYQRLSVELFPNIAYPSITVQTNFPDTAPQEVEALVTRPVEEAVGVLRGLQRIRSVSRSGASEVTLEFRWGVDMGLLSMDVREKLDRLILPEGALDPIVLRFDPSLEPVMRLAFYGDGALAKMRYFAENKLKPALETVSGVAAAQIRGGLQEEIRVELDQERLAALKIPLSEVRATLQGANINLPGGALRGENRQFLIRTLNEFDSVEEIASLVVREQNGAQVRLRDLAKVFRGAKERTEISRVNGEECIELAIFKEGDANSVTVARALDEKLAHLKRALPKRHDLKVLYDPSHFIESAVNEVSNAALIGGLLATLILLIFLRDLRSTLIIATAIPLSIVATFMLMYRWEITLNVMSLGGLTLGIGMLVDNAIVVLESIFRRRQEGAPLAKAAVEGATSVGPAIVASTLTTVAVFLPIVFVEGIAGQLFKDQAFTVTMSLLASLVVAVTMIPMLGALGRSGGREPKSAPQLRLLSTVYDRALRFAVRQRYLTVLFAFACFGLSVRALMKIETELIPAVRTGEFYFELVLPDGASLAATDRVMRSMEAKAKAEQDVKLFYATVGRRQAPGGLSLTTEQENLGQLNIALEPGAKEVELASALRGAYRSVPDTVVKFGRPSYFSLSTPIEVMVYSDELEPLRRYSIALAKRLAQLEGLVDVRSSLEAGNPELQVIFDRKKIAARGLDMAQLSQTLRDRVQGAVPTRYKEEDRQIDVRVLNTEDSRASIEDVRRLVVPGAQGEPVRLISVADVNAARGPAEIHRAQQQRVAVVSANLKGTSLSAAVAAIEAELQRAPPPSKMTVEIGGQNREMQVSFASLRFALMLAVFLVYLVMASTFESLIHPLVVLFTIPLALVGVVLGLLATDTSISVVVLLGAIMLVGIVVNNAIVLIDAINKLRDAGRPRVVAVLEAGHLRLRPILMTTLTTSLGLLPMALGLGEGAELRAPLAITVACGLLLSTLLTLLVIPAAYLIVPEALDRREAPIDAA